jgi:hypothetical protein
MDTQNTIPSETTPIPTPSPRKWPKRVGAVVALGAALGIGAAIGSAGNSTKTVAGPTKIVTKTVTVPGPARTVIKDVPGPTKVVTKTVTVPASQGPTGTTIATYSGHGNQVTGSFGVPGSGDYILKWSYSNNTDPSIGGGSNFSISDTNTSGMQGNTPNDIASSGSGSTEDTGMSGSQSFNVQATGDWTITVVSAP